MSFWTPEKTARAKTLWLSGMSATQVAREIGHHSRNAVIGIAFRQGWTRDAEVNAFNRRQARMVGRITLTLQAEERRAKEHEARAARPKSPRPRRNKNPLSLPNVVRLAQEHEPMEAVNLRLLGKIPKSARHAEDVHIVGIEVVNLEPHHCRWPISDWGEVATRFCGAGKEDGSSYCPGHAFRAHDRQADPRPMARAA